MTVYMRVNSTVNKLGQPVVTFQYNDGVGGWQTYDTVTFLMPGVTSVPGYVVNGFQLPPIGAPLFWDAELTLGGYGDGLYTVNGISDLQMQLMYWNGNNYQMIKNAYNHGGNTAESITNVDETFEHYTDNGTLYAEVNETPENLGSLWNQSQISLVTLKTALSSGYFTITSKSLPEASPADYGFTGGLLTATLFPGSYVFKLYTLSGTLYKSITLNVLPGQTYDTNV
jgi:Thermopsin